MDAWRLADVGFAKSQWVLERAELSGLGEVSRSLEESSVAQSPSG